MLDSSVIEDTSLPINELLILYTPQKVSPPPPEYISREIIAFYNLRINVLRIVFIA